MEWLRLKSLYFTDRALGGVCCSSILGLLFDSWIFWYNWCFLEESTSLWLAANILTVSELFDSVAKDFFNKIIQSPEEKTSSQALRPRGHQFQISTCVYKLFKMFFCKPLSF